jgi:TatD DNase family protein
MLIDSHCHLYDETFKDDLAQVIENATNNGIEKMLLPNCDSTTIEAMLQLEMDFPGTCYAMMGLHPCYVKENYKEELNIAEAWLAKRKFIAVGEIGLDFYWDKTFIKEQEIALRVQIEWALHYNYPIVLHTRDSIDETIAIISEYCSKGLQGVFHCFSGNEAQAKKITDELGFYIGIGGVLTFKNAGVKEAIKNITLDNIIFETDAPYLAPTPYRGKRNESAYVRNIAEFYAIEMDIALSEVSEKTSTNCIKLFGL